MRTFAWIGGAALALAAAAALGAGLAGATPPSAASAARPAAEAETPDEPLTGDVLSRVSGAALRHTGGGAVTETEIGDDGAAYGVEVRKPDGRHVEVNLDDAFVVTGEEADDAD